MQHPDKSAEAREFVYRVANARLARDPNLHPVLAVRYGQHQWSTSAERQRLIEIWKARGFALQESFDKRREGRTTLHATLGEMAKVRVRT